MTLNFNSASEKLAKRARDFFIGESVECVQGQLEKRFIRDALKRELGRDLAYIVPERHFYEIFPYRVEIVDQLRVEQVKIF